MASRKDLIKLINRLIELTQEEKIKWEGSPPPIYLVSDNNHVDLVYQTHYKNKILRVYKEKYKDYTDDYNFTWDEQVVIQFADDEGRAIWTFPQIISASDLLEAIRYKDAGVDEFIDDILNVVDDND